MRIVRRRRFLNDVTAAYAYLSNESPVVAEALLEAVEALVALLADFPEIGRSRPELGVGVRAVVLRRFRYILFYRALSDRVVLLRLIHGARNIRRGMV